MNRIYLQQGDHLDRTWCESRIEEDDDVYILDDGELEAAQKELRSLRYSNEQLAAKIIGLEGCL